MVQVILPLRQEASNKKVILKIDVSAGIGKSQKQKHEIKNRKAIKNRCQCWHREITKNRKTRLAIEKQF